MSYAVKNLCSNAYRRSPLAHRKALPAILSLILLAFFPAEGTTAATAEETGEPMRLYVRGYGGDFSLTDHHARTFSLADLRGKIVLIYFGYTSCADVCPTTLIDLAAAMRELGPSAELVQPLMVTVDPKRDTREKLKDFLPHFHPSVLGLTGTREEITAVTRLFRAPAYERKPDKNGFYVVDHSSHLYAVDPDGRLAYLIPYGTPPEKIAAVVQDLLESTQKAVVTATSRSPRGSMP